MNEEQPDSPEPIDYASPGANDASPEPSTGGAKLFVIFFLTVVPLLGFAIVGLVIYRLLVR
jgi:hypothetical protein